jgi:hypothetical protein
MNKILLATLLTLFRWVCLGTLGRGFSSYLARVLDRWSSPRADIAVGLLHNFQQVVS